MERQMESFGAGRRAQETTKLYGQENETKFIHMDGQRNFIDRVKYLLKTEQDKKELIGYLTDMENKLKNDPDALNKVVQAWIAEIEKFNIPTGH